MEGNQELLARVDERTQTLQQDLIALKLKLEKNYVNQQEFFPVKRLVYGAIALILTGVFGGLLALVIRV